MKVPLTQLDSHLARGLDAIYLVAADEPLLVGEATDVIRRAAMHEGFEERNLHVVDRGFRWDSLLADSDSLSLFAARRIIELRMQTPRPGDAGAKAIRALAEQGDPDRVVIISIQTKLDRNASGSVWVKTIAKQGVVVEIRPITVRELPAFITRRAQRHGLTIDRDAAELLAERAEGNLLAADQELIKLSLICDDARVDVSAVLESVATSARFDVFRLSDAIIAGDLPRVMRVLDGLKTEGIQPPLILWAVAREIAQLARLRRGVSRGANVSELMNRLRIWQSRQPALRRALQRYSDENLVRLLRRAAQVDRIVKGLDQAPVWESLTGLVLEMMTPEQHRLEA